MGCPILGWDAIIPSWDGMYGISHLGMEIILPILGWDGKMGYPILGWADILNAFFFSFFAVVNPVPSSFFLCMGCPILGWDARIPSWDGMYGISHLGMEIILPILGWDEKMGYLILGWDGILNAFFFLFFCGC